MLDEFAARFSIWFAAVVADDAATTAATATAATESAAAAVGTEGSTTTAAAASTTAATITALRERSAEVEVRSIVEVGNFEEQIVNVIDNHDGLLAQLLRGAHDEDAVFD